jgi:fatty acid-binding protein DegV
MRMLDTRSLFVGAAPCIVEAVRLMQANETPAAIRERLAYIAENSYGYMLPRDLYYLRARAKKKGDRSVGLLSAVLGSTLDIKPLIRAYRGETTPVGKVRGWEHGCETLFAYAAERVRAGLLVPVMCIAYGGDLAELPKLPGYDKLVKACEACDVRLLQAPMSITGMVNVGVGALTIGFAAEEHSTEF